MLQSSFLSTDTVMVVSTKGIVLHTTKFGDTSAVVKIFTREFGNQSFIVKGAYRKNNRHSISLFGPLSLLEISYDDTSRGSLLYLKDVTPMNKSNGLFFNPVRSSILIFYNEVLYKLLSDFGADLELFDYVENQIDVVYSASEVDSSLLPLKFLLGLSSVMGYFPEDNYSEKNCCFNLQEGKFVMQIASNEFVMSSDSSRFLHLLLNHEFDGAIPRDFRNVILKSLVTYFQIRNDNIRKIDSIDVLGSVLH